MRLLQPAATEDNFAAADLPAPPPFFHFCRWQASKTNGRVEWGH